MAKHAIIKCDDGSEEDTEITRITQDDFLAQLTQALAAYDHDKDGLLSDADWDRVAKDLGRGQNPDRTGEK